VRHKMTDVWQLEDDQQIAASEDLNDIIDCAMDDEQYSIDYLKSLWPECSWQTIKKRINTESSVWYVWYMDGVNQHIANQRKRG